MPAEETTPRAFAQVTGFLGRIPRASYALLGLGFLALLLGYGARPICRATSPRFAVAVEFHSNPYGAYFKSLRLDEPRNEMGFEPVLDPWGTPWLVGHNRVGGWAKGTVDEGTEPRRSKVYSAGPNRIDEHGGGDDILVPALTAAPRPPRPPAFFMGMPIPDTSPDLRPYLGPVADYPTAVEFLIRSRELGLALGCLLVWAGITWWLVRVPRSRRRIVEALRTGALSLCLAVLGVVLFEVVTWAWVPLSAWQDALGATPALVGFPAMFCLTLLGGSTTIALGLRLRHPLPEPELPEDNPTEEKQRTEPEEPAPPTPEKRSRLVPVGIALLTLSIASWIGAVVAWPSEPVALGRTLSDWISKLGGSEEDQILALIAIGRIGPEAGSAVQPILTTMRRAKARGDTMVVTPQAIHALAAIGEPAIPALAKNVRAPSSFMSDTHALRALALMGPKAAPAMPDILSVLRGNRRRSSILAKDLFKCLGSIGPAASEAVEDILPYIKRDAIYKQGGKEINYQRPVGLRFAAIEALGKMASPRAAEGLLAFLKTLPEEPLPRAVSRDTDFNNWLLKKLTIQALGNLGHHAQASVPVLLDRAFNKAECDLQPSYVAQAVLKITGGEIDPKLVEPGLDHEHSRAAAAYLLGLQPRLSKETIGKLLALSGDKDPGVRKAVAAALGRQSGAVASRCLPALEQQLAKETDPEVLWTLRVVVASLKHKTGG